jgi:hypothetical protein
MRPPVPSDKPQGGSKSEDRQPWEFDPELAKFHAIRELINKSGELSDVNDTFQGYEAQLKALNEKGYDCSLRLSAYKEFRRTSPDHLRMARNEIVRLLSQPKIVVHGGDLIRDDTKEPGFFANVINGGKKLLGMKTDQDRVQPGTGQ